MSKAKPALVIKAKKLVPTAVLPTKERASDAGFDLYTLKKERLSSNAIKAIETGIAIEIPKGYRIKIRERSGYSLSNTLMIKAGVIDNEYRGEIKVIMQNSGSYPVEIPAGTKFAQMVLELDPEVTIEEVEELSDTDRGIKGFGSSDKPSE